MNNSKEKTPLPFMAKACMFLAGYTNPFLGYAIYFVMYDSDREKAEYFRKGGKFWLISTPIIVILYPIIGALLTFLGI